VKVMKISALDAAISVVDGIVAVAEQRHDLFSLKGDLEWTEGVTEAT